jgi:hypothetical protein
VELAVTLTEADYETWRRQRDWTAWKDRMHDLALALLTQLEGISRCFCGDAQLDANRSRSPVIWYGM